MPIHSQRANAPDPFLQRPIARRSFLLPLAASAASGTPAQTTVTRTGLLPLVRAARSQIGVTLRYDPAYTRIAYPNGDVPLDRGVCTDVVIRAYRKAYDCDLQRLVHEDMVRAFHAYPRSWGIARPDANIDHRRVPNLQTFFGRRKASRSITSSGTDYLPRDIVTVMLVSHVPHIMIVSDRRSGNGVPLVIHNIGSGTQEEDYLFTAHITGHYRFMPPASSA